MKIAGKPNIPIAEEGSLALYLKEIGKLQPLTSDKEAELAAGIRKGDREALDTLVKANLRFVVSVARNYQNQGLSLCDLINEGNMGLVKAAARFDEKKNFRFISYAVWWVRQAILQALAEQSRIMRLPLNRAGAIHKISKTQIELEQRFNRMPDTSEIARELEMTESAVQETISISNNYVSLDAPIKDNNGSTLIDLIGSPQDGSGPDDGIRSMSYNEEIMQMLESLTEREREIIKLYFGIDYDNAFTLDEIGRKFKITRERVRQIKSKALNRLKSAHGVPPGPRRRRRKAASVTALETGDAASAVPTVVTVTAKKPGRKPGTRIGIRAAMKLTGKPIAKPIVKPVAKPIVKLIQKLPIKPLAKIVAKPPVKSPVKPSAKTVTKSSAKLPIKSSSKPVTKTSVKPSAKVSPKSTIKPIAKPAAKTSAKPTSKSAVKPAAKSPVKKSAVKPVAKSSAKKPMIKTIAKPSPKPVTKSTVKSPAKPVTKSKSIVKKVAVKPTVKSSVKPVTKSSAKSAVKSSVKKSSSQILSKPVVKKTVKPIAKTPTKTSAKKPVGKPPVKSVSKKSPAKAVIKKSSAKRK